MKQFLTMICCVLFPCLGMGQYVPAKERPDWVNGFHADRPNSYIHVVSATGYSAEHARKKAIEEISKERSLATGQEVRIEERNGHFTMTGRDQLTVKARIVDEYTEQLKPGTYQVSLLVQTAKHPDNAYEPVHINDKYPVTARILVPGMAQLHKGSTTKGVAFIAAEALALGGVVAFECLRASYDFKIDKTHDAQARKDYITKADNMENIRNGCIAGAAVIYLWNIIDGAVAKGKRHVEVGNLAMRISPYATPRMAGINLCIHF